MLAALAPNPLDEVWPDQPEPPHARAVPHPLELAGETSESKRGRLAEELKKRGADAAVLTLADSICWLLNIRGADVPHTPFVLAFAMLNADASVDLFLDPRKSSPELATHLGNQVRVRAPAEFAPALDALKGKTRAGRSAMGGRLHLRPARTRRAPRSCGRRSLPAAQGLQERGGARGHAARACARRRGAVALPRLVRARGAVRRADRDRRRREAGRLPPRHRRAEGCQLRFDFGRRAERRHRALPRHAEDQPAHRDRTIVPDRFRRAISRTAPPTSRAPSPWASRPRRCATASPAC